jgi:hypothetical protein
VPYLTGFLRFWWDFIIGDDWKIAAGVALVLAVDAALVASTDLPNSVIALVGAIGIVSVAMASIVGGALSQRRA